MGSFEDSIRNKFEGKSVKAPKSAWSAVEHGLNADFVSTYHSRQSRYKWIAAAAMLVAMFSFALQFNPIYPSDGSAGSLEGNTYNALLANGAGFLTPHSAGTAYSFDQVFIHVASEQTSSQPQTTTERFLGAVPQMEPVVGQDNLSHITSALQLAQVDSDIYRYHQGGAYSSLGRSKKKGEKKLWAGVEAGAGNFSSSLASSNVYAGSINQSNLASALGSDGFVNPSTQVNPDLDNGIATSLGLDLGMRVGNRWTFETGIAYTNVDARGDATINVLDIYTVDNGEFFGSQNETDLPISSSSRETAFEVQDSYDYDVDLRSNLRFTSIPVKAGYFLMDRKMSLRLNVGLAANYFMGSQVTAQDNVLNGSIDDSFNSWSFDGLGGFEIGYSILDNFDVTFEPNYRQSITPLTDSNASESRFLVQTGLKYRIQ